MPERHPDHDLIQGEWTERSLVEKLLEPVEKPPPRPWKVVAAVGFVLTLAWLYAIFVTFTKGLGTWGSTRPAPGGLPTTTSAGGSPSAPPGTRSAPSSSSCARTGGTP